MLNRIVGFSGVGAGLLAGLLLLVFAPWSDTARGEPASSPAETGLMIYQDGQPVPLTVEPDGSLAAVLDRAPFELLFPRSAFRSFGFRSRDPNVRILLSEDPRLFGYIREPFFADYVSPGGAYAIPPEGEHYLMTTEVDFANHLTGHNNLFDHRLNVQKEDAVGIAVDRIVDRSMTDLLQDLEAPLYVVILIHRGSLSGDLASEARLASARIDYLMLSFRE